MNSQKKIVKYLEYIRIGLCALGFFLAYSHSFSSKALFWLVALVVIPLSGLTGLESLIFAKAAAQQKGRAVSPYQIQSAMNNLAVAITAMLILFLQWGQQARVVIITVSLVFFILSASEHFREAVRFSKEKSKHRWIHWQRVVLTLLLCIAIIPLIVPYFL